MNWLKWMLGIVVVLGAVLLLTINTVNQHQTNGSLILPILDNPAKVIRDEKGMAYVYANTINDAIRIQGYVTAQDRLFQMLLVRTLVQGKLAELFGDAALESDKLQRTLGFYRVAHEHAERLDAPTRQLLQVYADGVNQYLQQATNEHPVEVKLAKLKTTPWEIVDSIAIMYYMGWGSAANIKAEILSLKLIDKIGFEKFSSLYPITLHPNDNTAAKTAINNAARTQLPAPEHTRALANDPALQTIASITNSLATGSNNWVTNADHSQGEHPIVVNDPHLVTRLLPTAFYPIGLITQNIRVVGANVPGIPSVLVGRNEYVATGVTNQYGDAQDLYIETIAPNNPLHYLEGDQSIAFTHIQETIKIKDDKAKEGVRSETLDIRLTKRGPVISNIEPSLKSDKVISVRWSPWESMQPSLGLDLLLNAKSVVDIKAHLANFTVVHLNFVFADVHGNIGWQTTGKLPIRAKGNGTVPLQVVDASDDWVAWIPYDEMPQSYNPPQGWLATANNKTVTSDYPYYYSSWFAPNNRYQRITELLSTPGKKTANQHWQFMHDDFNVTARELSPIIAAVLLQKEETKQIGEILTKWDFRETLDSTATSIYQETYRHLVHAVFSDELGEELASSFIGSNYYWQERFGLMLKQGTSEWFDNVHSKPIETLTQLIQQAGMNTIEDLSARISKDPNQWQWGKIHTINFVNPIRREGIGANWLGGGNYPMSGSGDTLLRALYPLNEQGNTVHYSATLRMVADLSDQDKVMTILPGGVSGRTFSDHFDDQVPDYMNGQPRYWWFSDQQIQQHSKSELSFVP